MRADLSVMDNSGRQIQTIACLQHELFSQSGQAKRNAAVYHVNDFVIPMRVSRIDVMRAVRPGVGTQSFIDHPLPERRLSRWFGIRPGGDYRSIHLFMGEQSQLMTYGSTGYPASSQARKPPRIGFTRVKPFCINTFAARALVSSLSQVQYVMIHWFGSSSPRRLSISFAGIEMAPGMWLSS